MPTGDTRYQYPVPEHRHVERKAEQITMPDCTGHILCFVNAETGGIMSCRTVGVLSMVLSTRVAKLREILMCPLDEP